MSDKPLTLDEYRAKYHSAQGPVMNEVLDVAYEKLGPEVVNELMAKVAAQLAEFTGVEIGWHNVKDSCSWQHTDYGTAFFKKRKPRVKQETPPN